jgi:hypothetical protein
MGCYHKELNNCCCVGFVVAAAVAAAVLGVSVAETRRMSFAAPCHCCQATASSAGLASHYSASRFKAQQPPKHCVCCIRPPSMYVTVLCVLATHKSAMLQHRAFVTSGL